MAPKNNRKNKGASPSSSGQNWSSKFESMLSGRYERSFKWEISNFSLVNDRTTICSDYFDLDGFQFRFLLFPRGQAAARNKYLSLQLDVNEAHFTTTKTSCFISSKITLENHVNASNSLYIPIVYRFTSENPSISRLQITRLESLHDLERGFLLKHTDLHIRGSVFYLDEKLSIRMLPVPAQQQEQLNAEDASPSNAGNESLPDVCKGELVWTLNNYFSFEDLITLGIIKSHTIHIGQCRYSMSVGDPTETKEQDKLCMLMSLEPQVNNESEIRGSFSFPNAWFVADIEMTRPNLKKITKINVFERIGRWLEVTKMSEFRSSLQSRLIQGTLVFTFKFYAFMDRDIIHRNVANSKTIWNFGECLSKSNAAADKPFIRYTWQFQNFLSIENIIKRSPADKKIEIKGRRVRVDGTDFNVAIHPLGDADHPNHLGVYLELNPLTDGFMSRLVHIRVDLVNQKKPEQTIRREQIFRFGLAAKLFGFSDFIPIPIFYEKTAGYIDEGRTVFESYIYVLEEAYDDKSLNVPGEGRRGTEISRIRWRVDNFLAWEGIVGAITIPSKPIILNGCLLRILVYVSDDGVLYGTLTSEIPIVKFSDICLISYEIGLMKQRRTADRIDSSEFKATEEWYTNSSTISRIGVLSDILKKGVDYILNDKIAFFCNFYSCTRIEDLLKLQQLNYS